MVLIRSPRNHAGLRRQRLPLAAADFGQASRGALVLFGENKRAPVPRRVKLNLTAR